MKKLLCLLLVSVLFLSLSACGNTDSTNSTSESSKTFDISISENVSSEDKSSSSNPKWTVDSVRRNAISDISLSEEDVAVLENLLSSDKWIDDLTDCASDVTLECDNGKKILYCSECGTFNDIKNQKSLSLDKDETNIFNELLSKYVELGL